MSVLSINKRVSAFNKTQNLTDVAKVSAFNKDSTARIYTAMFFPNTKSISMMNMIPTLGFREPNLGPTLKDMNVRHVWVRLHYTWMEWQTLAKYFSARFSMIGFWKKMLFWVKANVYFVIISLFSKISAFGLDSSVLQQIDT